MVKNRKVHACLEGDEYFEGLDDDEYKEMDIFGWNTVVYTCVYWVEKKHKFILELESWSYVWICQIAKLLTVWLTDIPTYISYLRYYCPGFNGYIPWQINIRGNVIIKQLLYCIVERLKPCHIKCLASLSF